MRGKVKKLPSYHPLNKDQMNKVNYFSEAEIKRMLDEIEDPTDRLLFIMGVELGPRVNGISFLRFEDLDWDEKIVRIWDEKKDRYRFCTIPTSVWKLLKKEHKARIREISEVEMELKDMKQKARKRGRRLDKKKSSVLRKRLRKLNQGEIFLFSYKTINRKIKLWAKKAMIQRRVRWHMLRHTYVIQSRRCGRDWGLLSQQTGNSVANLIESYGKPSMEDRKRITDETKIIKD